MPSHKQSNVSKALQNLPTSLSDYTWIENTELNRQILDDERAKQLEIRKQKELERRSSKFFEANSELKESCDQIMPPPQIMINHNSVNSVSINPEIDMIDPD